MGRKLDNDHTYRLLSAEHLVVDPSKPCLFPSSPFHSRPGQPPETWGHIPNTPLLYGRGNGKIFSKDP